MSKNTTCTWRVTFMALLTVALLGARATPSEFTRAELQQDLSLLRSTLERTHPSLYRYTIQEQMDALFDEAQRGLRDGMTLLEFQRTIALPVAEIRCSHTSWDLPTSEFGAFMSTARFLPLSVQFLGERLFVRKNLSGDPSLRVGSEILSINGSPTREVVQELFSFVPTDGQGTALKYRTLERMFSIHYRMYVGDPPAYTLELLTEGEVAIVELAALPYGEMRRNAAQNADPPQDDGPPLSFTELEDGTALLVIRTFSEATLVRAGMDYESFLDEVFQRVDEADLQHLIVDLRDNGGGEDDFGSLLFSYLILEPTPFYAAHSFRGQDYADFEATDLAENPVFQEYARRLDPSGDLPPLTKVFEEMVRTGWDHEPVAPRGPGFEGSLSILMNGATGSTAAEVVTMTAAHTGATLIGEEAAAAMVGCSGGLFTTLTLPHSGMSFRLPVFQYRNNVPAETPVGDCPQPDYLIIPTMEQNLAGEDPELEFALDLIAHGSSPWKQPRYVPPTGIETARMVLEPLAPRHVERDYAALMSSREHLQRTLQWGTWPREGFTLDENLADLEMHWREFEERVGFAYTVLTPDRQRCLGCVYFTPIDPSQLDVNRALFAYWVIEDELETELDRHLLESILTWVKSDWPFEAVGLLVHDDNTRGSELARAAELEVAEDAEVPGNQVYRWER